MDTTEQLKVRVSADTYSWLRHYCIDEGMSMSAFVGGLIAQARHRIDINLAHEVALVEYQAREMSEAFDRMDK